MPVRYLSVDEITNLLEGRTSEEVIDLLADNKKRPKEIAVAPRDCLNCNTRFTPRQPGQLYCCKRCRVAARRKRRNIDIILNQRTCEWCGGPIPENKRSHAKYCTTKCRLEAAGAELCVYCGEPADTVDHFIPKAFVKKVYELGWHDTSRNVRIPACRECNSTAGSEVFATLREKREYIHDRYRRRYRKLLNMPNWTSTELEQLTDGSLRSFIIGSVNAQKIMRSRLRWKS